MQPETIEILMEEKARKLLKEPRVSVSKFVDTIIEELTNDSIPFQFYWEDLTIKEKEKLCGSLVAKYKHEF